MPDKKEEINNLLKKLESIQDQYGKFKNEIYELRVELNKLRSAEISLEIQSDSKLVTDEPSESKITQDKELTNFVSNRKAEKTGIRINITISIQYFLMNFLGFFVFLYFKVRSIINNETRGQSKTSKKNFHSYGIKIKGSDNPNIE